MIQPVHTKAELDFVAKYGFKRGQIPDAGDARKDGLVRQIKIGTIQNVADRTESAVGVNSLHVVLKEAGQFGK